MAQATVVGDEAKASSTSLVCSMAWLEREPVAGLPRAPRETQLSGSRRPSDSARLARTQYQAP